MNLKENIRRILREEISAKEAYSSYGSIKTIIDGKRDVAFIELNNIVNRLLISLKSLKKIKVPSSTESNYIVYREGSEKEAQELYNIAMKYDGSLSYIASEEDSRRIGQILGYRQDDIEDYIKHNKKIRGITENIRRIQEMMGLNENLSPWFKRRFDIDELDDLVKDVKDQIEEGESLSTAIYDTVRQFIATKNFSDIDDTGTEQQYWDSYLRYEKPMIKYVKEKLGLTDINESSFLRRRVDVSTLDSDVLDNLNYVTDIFLSNLRNGDEISFDHFKERIITGIIDNYHGDLSNWGQDEFPYDQIYNFLLDRYLPKIESRYNWIISL